MNLFIPATVAAMLIAGAAAATTTTLSLGQSAENYVLFGQGPVSPGVGSFTNQQGAETGVGTVTDTLSGVISGSSDSGLASGSYSFVTTYTGVGIASGGSEIQSQSNPVQLNQFFYTYFDPSVDMTLYLTGTPTGNHTINLVTNGMFDVPGFSFAYTNAQCSGVTVCGQNNVGLTPGSSQFGPVDISVSYTVAGVPEPASWALMLAGAGVLGGALRGRRRAIAA